MNESPADAQPSGGLQEFTAALYDEPASGVVLAHSPMLDQGFGLADRLLVQIPAFNGFAAAFARQAGAELFFRVVEGLLGSHSCAIGFVVGVFNVSSAEEDFGTPGMPRRSLVPIARRGIGLKCLVRGSKLFRPAPFRLTIQPIQGSIGSVRSFPHPFLLAQPSHHRPAHRLGHQLPGIFYFWQLFRRILLLKAKAIADVKLFSPSLPALRTLGSDCHHIPY